jgi:hypothetical protein
MLSNLAQVYSFEGRYADSEKLYLQAIHIWERAFGPLYPELAGCLSDYAAVLRKLRRSKEAAELEARAKRVQAAHARDYTASTLVDWRELQRH